MRSNDISERYRKEPKKQLSGEPTHRRIFQAKGSLLDDTLKSLGNQHRRGKRYARSSQVREQRIHRHLFCAVCVFFFY